MVLRFVLLGFLLQSQTVLQWLQVLRLPTEGVPPALLHSTFNAAELKIGPRTYVALRATDANNGFSGPFYVLRFEAADKPALVTRLPLTEDDACLGSPEGVEAIDGYLLVSTHLSPSAGCLHVLDGDLHYRKTLYGFSAARIAEGQIVLVEDLIHFAPVHPERLQYADLKTGDSAELYPAKGDALRMQLSAENAAHMPARAICMKQNDPCSPELFDEDIRVIGTDGQGRFAFTVYQSASHALVDNEPPETVASQVGFYSYRHMPGGWLYCSEELNDAEAKTVETALKSDFKAVADRCRPARVVVPDMSTAQMNPFHPLQRD